MTTIGNVSSDEVTIANVYDEIVSAGTFVAFDDLGKTIPRYVPHGHVRCRNHGVQRLRGNITNGAISYGKMMTLRKKFSSYVEDSPIFKQSLRTIPNLLKIGARISGHLDEGHFECPSIITI